MSLSPQFAAARRAQSGPAQLRARILAGLAHTGSDPWLVSEIAAALHVSPLSARQACEVLAQEGRVEIVARDPFAVRRVGG